MDSRDRLGVYGWRLCPPPLSPRTSKNKPKPCLLVSGHGVAQQHPPPSSPLSPLPPGPRARLWPLRQAQRRAAPSKVAPRRILPVLQDPHQQLPPSSLWARPVPWPLHTSPTPGHRRNTGETIPCQGLGTEQLYAPTAPASALHQPPHSEMGPGSRHLCNTMWSASGKEGSSSLQASTGRWGRA